jgi:hypothetical protein
MSFDPKRRRAALAKFLKGAELHILPLAKTAGLGEATVRGFLAGRTRTLSDETYERLADAASRMLRRRVLAGELRGEKPAGRPVTVGHCIKPGDHIVALDDGDPALVIIAPPGCEEGHAAVVQGDHESPAYENGDVVFWSTEEEKPSPSRRLVVARLKTGERLLKKILPGTMAGLFHLISVNPATPPLVDQEVEAISRVVWHKPAELI